MTDWLEAMNPTQRAAAWELTVTGRMTPDLLAALREGRLQQAAGLARADAPRIARALETGEVQG